VPDGIPYGIYKKLWGIKGPFILASWKHSCTSQREPVLTLLPKVGKDTKNIKN
jgi:hypothetical protein